MRLLLLAIAFVAGCSDAQHETARDDWESRAYSDYEYELTRGGECSICKVSVEVRGGQVVEAADLLTGEALQPTLWQSYGPMDVIFDKIQEGIDYPAVEVDVTYDSVHGFPSSVLIVWDNNPDGEYDVSIRNFALLQ